MTDGQFPAYEDLPDAIVGALGRLRGNPDADVANDALRVQLWSDEFHRAAVTRLLTMILAWRGELFLESLLRDEVMKTFFGHYGVSDPN